MRYRIDGHSTNFGTTFTGPNWAVSVEIEGRPTPIRLEHSGKKVQWRKQSLKPWLMCFIYDLYSYTSLVLLGAKPAYFSRMLLVLGLFVFVIYTLYFRKTFCEWHAAEHFALDGTYVSHGCGSNYFAWIAISLILYFPLSLIVLIVRSSQSRPNNKILEFFNFIGRTFQSWFAVRTPPHEIQTCTNRAYNMLILLESQESPRSDGA
jgi:hypothetical protein